MPFGYLMPLSTLVPDNLPVALGLAEIGQEELGKSLSLLAAFSLPSQGSIGYGSGQVGEITN